MYCICTAPHQGVKAGDVWSGCDDVPLHVWYTMQIKQFPHLLTKEIQAPSRARGGDDGGSGGDAASGSTSIEDDGGGGDTGTALKIKLPSLKQLKKVLSHAVQRQVCDTCKTKIK